MGSVCSSPGAVAPMEDVTATPNSANAPTTPDQGMGLNGRPLSGAFNKTPFAMPPETEVRDTDKSRSFVLIISLKNY